MIFISLPKTDTSPLPPPSIDPQSADGKLHPVAAVTSRRSRRPSSRGQHHARVPAASPSSSTSPSPSALLSSSSLMSSQASISGSVTTPCPSTPEIHVPSSAIPSSVVQRDLARVWEAVSDSRRIIVVCGAGISVSEPAGIPDFRSSTGLFKSLKEQHPEAGLTSGKDLFDARLFQSEANTALFYSMIASLHKMTVSAHPTLFHHFLKRLDEQGRLQRVYTQNIDALEERAGLTFGLGEGAGRLFKKTASLGKRKRTAGQPPPSLTAAAAPSERQGPAAPPPPTRRRGVWNKSQSAPSISLAPIAPTLFGPSPEPTTAMFPRVIPLHGSLANLVCTACDHKMATLSTPSSDVTAAIKSLAEGEPPECPACSERDAVRLAAGLRSRGIGCLKPDVVLYNGENKSGERVGECLERDVLGLRDPLDGQVPETFTERNHRKKRADRDAGKAEANDYTTAQAVNAAKEDSGEDASQSMLTLQDALKVEDVLGNVFEADERDEEEEGNMADILAKCSVSGFKLGSRKSIQRAATQPSPATMVKQLSKTSSDGGGSTSGTGLSGRNVRLKPLPPDLLIVAGTSLKVPGTKRVVREFAKAARARDGIIPKGCKTRLNTASEQRERSNTPSSRSRSRSRASAEEQEEELGERDADDGGSDEEGAREDGSNPHRPIRTILLNYEFPVPSKEWEGMFDVWIQGDVQASAAGLWKATAGYGMGRPLHAGDESDEDDSGADKDEVIDGCQSWDVGIDTLDHAREMIGKPSRSAAKGRQSLPAAAEDKISKTSVSAPNSPKKNSRRASTGLSIGGKTAAALRKSLPAVTTASTRFLALKEEGQPKSRRAAARGGAVEGEDVEMRALSAECSDGDRPVIKVHPPPQSPAKGKKNKIDSSDKSNNKTKGDSSSLGSHAVATADIVRRNNTVHLSRSSSLRKSQVKLTERERNGADLATTTEINGKSVTGSTTSAGKAISHQQQQQTKVDKTFNPTKRRNSIPASSSPSMSATAAVTATGPTAAAASSKGNSTALRRKGSVGRVKRVIGGA